MQVCGKQYNGSTVAEFYARANNCKTKLILQFLKRTKTIKPSAQPEMFLQTLSSE